MWWRESNSCLYRAPRNEEMTVAERIFVTFCAYDWPENICGPASWVERLLPLLNDHGIRTKCLVLCWGGPGPLSQKLKESFIDHELIICDGTTQQRATWILDQLAASPPDIFVPNLVVPALYAARWLREAGIPTVGVLHSDDDFYRAVRDEFACGTPVFALSQLVCVSRELQQQTLDLKPKNTEVARIAYGVEIPEQAVQRNPERLRIAYLGRLSEEQKCISDVTKALIRATLEVPNVEAEIIGDGGDRKNVERILATADENSKVTLVGRLSTHEVQKRLMNVDVIVLLSNYEGLPIALLEAMACGVVPVCLAMRSGIPELVMHHETGIIVGDRGDDFVAAIRTLKDDNELWQRLSTAARNRIMAEYSHDTSTRQWANLIHSLAEKKTPSLPIWMPKHFDLPPVNPALAGEDFRAQTKKQLGFAQRAIRLAGQLKRSVFRARGRK
jgi:colanic acid/amylovoran biosynthesis glycosyltransferase